MAHEGQELVGRDGGRLRFVRITPDLLEMQAHFSGIGPLPPPHRHPHQEERFKVLDGAVRAIIDGRECRYTAGDTFEVPAGAVHQMGGDGPARVSWQVRPALRSAELAQALYEGLVAANPRAFLAKYAAEIELVPPLDDATGA